MFGLFKKKATPKQRKEAEIIQRLRSNALRAANATPGIAGDETLAHFATVLAGIVPEMVAGIACGDGDVYVEMWHRPDAYFDDLATLVTWALVTNTFKDASADEHALTEMLLHAAATMFPASERAQGLLARYNALRADPSELKARRVLMLYPGSDDQEARGTVFPVLVNEALDGPALDGPNFDDPGNDPEFERSLDPAHALYLRQWLCLSEIAAIDAYREALGLTRPDA